jgi:hypothetical protein
MTLPIPNRTKRYLTLDAQIINIGGIMRGAAQATSCGVVAKSNGTD